MDKQGLTSYSKLRFEEWERTKIMEQTFQEEGKEWLDNWKILTYSELGDDWVVAGKNYIETWGGL